MNQQLTDVDSVRTPDGVEAVAVSQTHTQTEEMICQPLQTFLHLNTQHTNYFTKP